MATSRDSVIFLCRTAFIWCCFCLINGQDDIYSNSHISPNSEKNKINDKDDLSIFIQNTALNDLNINPTVTSEFVEVSKHVGDSVYSSGMPNNEVVDGESDVEKDTEHVIVERSALPLLRNGFDKIDVFQSRNNIDSDEADIKSGRYLHLSPTRTFPKLSDYIKVTSAVSGEEMRAPRAGRNSNPTLLTEPSTTVTPPDTAEVSQSTARSRQTNHDIQDIITGIVKLLNGNVNVQANTAPPSGRPIRPHSNRINNRGPPRISDVPPLPPDFDSPISSNSNETPSDSVLPPPPSDQMSPPGPLTPSGPGQSSLLPTKQPPPYPFDLPNNPPIRPFINGVPLPEQLVPLATHTHRPTFGRPPNLPPWQLRPRPSHIPPKRRPPLSNIPPYKPMPPLDIDLDTGDEITFTSLEPLETATEGEHETLVEENEEHNVHLSSNSEENDNSAQTEATYHDLTGYVNKDGIMVHSVDNTNAEKEGEASSIEITTPAHHEVFNKNEYNKESLNFEKKPIKEKDKYHHKIDKPIYTQNEQSTKNEETNKINTTPVTTEKQTSKISTIVPSVSINYDLITEESDNAGIGEAIPVLETSVKEIEIMTSSATQTPTEGLPTLQTQTRTAQVTSTTVLNTSSSTSSSVKLPPETSIINTKLSISDSPNTQGSFPYYPYRPRPGIVLDDTEYKPVNHHQRHPPIITARPHGGGIGEIFDVTVSAIQGPSGSGGNGQGKPYIIPVDIDGVHVAPTSVDVITTPSGSEGFVSIDGKRTYLNLFGESSEAPQQIRPSQVSDGTIQVTGTGYAIPQAVPTAPRPTGQIKPTNPRRPIFGKRPTQQPVRIDTCIVGDDSTCDAGRREACRTDSGGVSACQCRPGLARRASREPCRSVVALTAAVRVDRIRDTQLQWTPRLVDPTSDRHRQLAYEVARAIDSAMSMTPFSDDFMEARVNSVFRAIDGSDGVYANFTLLLEEAGDTSRPQVAGDIQRHLLGVIQRRGNNIGDSALWVDSPVGAVSPVKDLDECSDSDLNDCHEAATCTNLFGSFTCECSSGLRDPWVGDRARAGRTCEQCPPTYCNNRGTCTYDSRGQQMCSCLGNYYGSQCEVDGEVLGVAVGASVAAVIIIILTLVCLVMWSRKWNREQKAMAAAASGGHLGGLGSPVFGYMTAGGGSTVKTPAVGPPPYQLTLEDRMRWAHLADVMAQANHYAPEPVMGNGTTMTRPSSAMFGAYPTLSLHHGTLGAAPVPLPRLNLQSARAASVHGGGMRSSADTSSSEEEDRADLLGRNFHVPRPKSRSSVANQSGIYYDVDYEQNDTYKPAGGIPMSTYTPGRPPYYRN